MKQFWKTVLAVIVGTIITGVVMSLFALSFFGALASLGESTPVVPSNGALKINMSEFVLAEQTREPDITASLNGELTPVLGILDAVRAINAAAEDPSIKYIYLAPDNMSTGLAQVEELRAALVNFRASGKPVVSYLENPGNAGIYLSSVSDKVYMTCHPGGISLVNGLSSQLYFLKDALDALGVDVQLIRHGKYKSAGEMYIRNSISAENRLQYECMLNAIWKSWVEAISSARGIRPEDFNAMIDNLELNLPEDFQKNHLVDEIVTKDQLKEKLCTLSMVDDFNDVQMISISDYAKVKCVENFRTQNKIAIVYADGQIVDGNEVQDVAGDRFAKIISDIRRDSSIKAVVLRVNSPGGSVLAAEKIKAELDLLKVPVIASYGAYAASGGYWISGNADYIFSDAGTLTGSIGVFSMIPNFGGTVKNKLKVGTAIISTNKHGDMLSGMRALDSDELSYMQASVEDIYDRFTSLVAEGRGMSVEAVDEIAQGRVWAGAEAIEIGLVDKIGTLEDAVRYAITATGAENTDFNNWQISAYPKPPTFLEQMMQLIEPSRESILAGTAFEGVESAFRSVVIPETGKAYARMPYILDIK